MLICDGPCHGIVDYTKMMEYPDCGHKICKMCQYNEISVPNVDGSPGCCVPTCVRQTLINRVPLEKYSGFLEGIKMYYTSASSIRDKEDLNPITIKAGDKKTLGVLAGGRSVLNFVIAKPGVYIFKNK
ncbi:unnamed protein product [Heligmosomoides polygyrus]|uniref:RING-type domain-containing protein n=1 Tax=Heligmosomoides polygyrus TaxID=6339 RepID=A0A183FV92_HELPZ|nr:unnamed protein product [Heligmosomoides polygyrus]